MGSEDEESEKLPICLQTLLWRHSSAYFNLRLTKHCESSSLIIERTLVQNIEYGFSRSVTDAMRKTPRWRLLKAALPFVMHCCARVIANFEESSFNSFESKILYTMHWLLLDASSECGVRANHPLGSLQLFVYLFAPLLKRINAGHFSSLKLQHGLKIWDALWNFTQPLVPGMCSLVKGRRNTEFPAGEEDEGDSLFASHDSVYCGNTPTHERDLHRLEKTQATYFDVAVLQCLMNSRWSADGVLWALTYVEKRLDEIIDSEEQYKAFDRSRSRSMPPLPIIEVSTDGVTIQSAGLAPSPTKEEDVLFIPGRISEDELLQRGRLKTDSRARKSGHKRKRSTAPLGADNGEETRRRSSYNLFKVTEDPLMDGKEKEETKNRSSNSLHPDGNRPIPNGTKVAKRPTSIDFLNSKHTPVGLVKKSQSLTPMLKVTPPSALPADDAAAAEPPPRSKSEPDVATSSPEFPDEVAGSIHYITEDGSINYLVLLKAVAQIMMNSKEPEIGNQVLIVMDRLVQIFTSNEGGKSPSPNDANSSLDEEKFHLIVETVIRSVVALGCATCSPVSTPFSSSRTLSNSMLQSLQRIRNDQFCKFFREYAEEKTLEDVADFCHASMGYCTRENARHFSDKYPFGMGQGGFATNFGHSISGEGHLGVEGIIVVQMLKIFVTRLSTTLTDPTKSDNVLRPPQERLYYNARKFLNYTQEVHGGTFRRVAFSGLLDSAKKLKEDIKAAAAAAAAAASAAPTTSASPSPVANKYQKLRDRKLQRQAARSTRSEGSGGRSALSDTELAVDSENEVKDRLVPGANTRVSKSDIEDTYTDDEDTKPKLSFQAVSQATLAIVKARRKVKGHIRMITSKQSVKDAVPGVTRRTSDLHSSRSLQAETKEKRMVDLYLIRSGMLRFSLLSSVCHPGSMPDPEFLAALLQLDAPVAARASLYLECAYFVSQCSQGNWPSWMQTYSNLSAQSGAYKRTIIQQRTAAALFYRWAEAIGIKLKSVIESESKNVFCVLDNKAGNQPQQEDYLDEASVNPNGETKFCPHPLKIVASLLIYEVTVFLREVYQNMPVVDPQYSKAWNALRPGRRTSSATGGASNRPSSPTPETGGFRRSILRALSAGTSAGSSSAKKPKRWALVSASIAKIKKDPTVSSSRTQRISLVGAADARASGAFGSTSSVNSTMGEAAHHRKASNTTSKPNKKLSATGSASSSSGVLMRSAARSIKLKSREHSGARSAKSSVTSFPMFNEAHSMYEGGISIAASDPSSPAEQDSYAEIYDELHNKLNWLTPIIQLASMSNFICEHTGICHSYCFLRQNRSCQLLTKALESIYEVDVTSAKEQVTVPVQPVSLGETKRPSVTRILLNNVVEATIGKRRSFDRAVPFGPLMKEPKKVVQKPPIIAYLKTRANNLMSVPLSVIMKSAAVLKEDEMASAAAVAWEFLLQSDKEIVATAASVLLMVAGQLPHCIQDLILTELHHVNVENRIGAIKRFYVLWTYRYQVWSRLEPGAQLWFKVMPPSIDYALPSPPVGLPGQIVPDPPWMPLYKLKLEELAANQEGSKSLVTATNTRRKQQQEMVAKALVAEECKKREARETFPLSSVPVSILAAQEFTKTNQPESDEALHGITKHEMCVIPPQHSLAASFSPSFRSPSSQCGGPKVGGELSVAVRSATTATDEVQETVPTREVVAAHSVFPPCVCLVGLALFDLLEDSESHNGSTVSATVENVIRACMIEDASLFFRYLFEKLTNPDRRSDMFKILRKLLVWMPNLPSNTAYILFNNLVGYVLFYNRSTNPNASVCMSQAMSVMWQLAPSVQGLNFKDLKTMLKKVQSEQTLMITAHLPSAKKIIVHGIDGMLPPQQFVVHEDTQFSAILQESCEYFSITEDKDHYQLADAKTSRMHSRHSYVRDFYVFRRNNTPHLKLVKLKPAESFAILQRQAMSMKFTEICKVELAKNVLQFTNQAHMENQVLFLHEEFSKQIAFPRKALETEFSYFTSTLGAEMQGTDVTHKLSWIQFLNTLFKSMPGTFGWTNELRLFLNVINGCLVLNCSDHGMLRACAAIYLNLANHFKQVFATEGFLLIMPTVIKVFNTHLNYPTVKSALLFLHGQFFKLHRRAYLLQFLGSYEPFISSAETKEDKQLLSEQLMELLYALERQEEDVLGIFHMVWEKKPIKTLDFCYDENEDYKVLDAINTMITVVTYQTECYRSTQMLVLLESIMPWYMKLLARQAHQNHPFYEKMRIAADEVSLYFTLSQSIRALVIGAEALMKPLATQHRRLEGVTSLSGHKKDVEDSVFSARVEEGLQDHEQEMERTMRNEFRRPRDALLTVVSEFFSTCLSRLEAQKQHIERLKITPSYYLDSKSHERLEEVAHSLLKVGTYDPETMACRGLQRYMQEILPEGDWSMETMKPAINAITKRLERIFVKVHKRASVRALADWDALATLLRGICLTLESQPTLHHLAHMKSLVNACISIVLEYGPGVEAGTAERWNVLPSHIFCSMVAKLAALHAAVLGLPWMETGGIEQLCGGSIPSKEKAEMMLANFIIPLCLRIGGNDKEKHILPQTDIRFILCLILSALVPQSVYVDMLKPKHTEQSQFGIHLTHHHTNVQHPHHSSLLIKKLAFLGMKAMLVCCESQLHHFLPLIAQSLAEVGRKSTCLEMYEFFDFVVSVRTIVYPLIRPFLCASLLNKNVDTEEEVIMQAAIREKITSTPAHRHKTQLLADFADELDRYRKALTRTLGSGEMLRSTSMSMNPFGGKRRFSTWRKSSLMSKIHQTDSGARPADRPPSVVNVSTVRASNEFTPDELTQHVPKLSRSATSKGSRYGRKLPPKRISASDGAKFIMDKFNSNTQLPLAAAAHRHYHAVAVAADTVVYEQPTEEEKLANAGRKGHVLHLIRQPHVIIEEEADSAGSPTHPQTSVERETTLSCPSPSDAVNNNDVTDSTVASKHGAVNVTESVPLSTPTKTPKVSKNYTFPCSLHVPRPECDLDAIKQFHRRPAVIRRISRTIARDQTACDELDLAPSFSTFVDVEEKAPPMVHAGYKEEGVLITQPDVRIMMPQQSDEDELCTASASTVETFRKKSDVSGVHTLHRQGALYQHAGETNDSSDEETTPLLHSGRYRYSAPGPLRSHESGLTMESLSYDIAPPQQVNTTLDTHTDGVTTPKKQPLKKVSIADFGAATATVTVVAEEVAVPTTSNIMCMGSNLATKVMLRRKGSDTAELVRNEQTLDKSNGDGKIVGITNLGSETTASQSAVSDSIPYIDHTSSSDGDASN